LVEVQVLPPFQESCTEVGRVDNLKSLEGQRVTIGSNRAVVTSMAFLLSIAVRSLPADFPADPQGTTHHGPPPRLARKTHPWLLERLSQDPAESLKVWVFLEEQKDHATAEARSAALAELTTTYHPRAIQRRRLRRTAPGLFDSRDLPVSNEYVRAVEATGARVHVISRWLNALSARVNLEQVENLESLPFISKIEPVRRGKRIEPVKKDDVAGSIVRGGFYGETEEQISQINLLALHAQGFTAAGVIVGVLDTGFHRTHQAFNEPAHALSVVAEFDFLNNDPNTDIEPGDDPDQHRHGTWILGTMAAYKPGVYVGGAFDASYILCKTEDVADEYPGEEDNYVAGLEFVEANGADLMTASLGYIDWYSQAEMNGLTAVTTIAVNTASENGVHCCAPAGNSGHDADPATSNLIAPADAFDAITCGAVSDIGNIASFSSDGPTADGRVKPEVLARGVNTRTVSSSNDVSYTGVNGTSLSTPLIAATVACLVQAHPEWTVEQMRRYLLFTAGDYAENDTFDLTFVRGYGIINAAGALAEDCNGNAMADPWDISSGQSGDCNENRLPDECDIAHRVSQDLDGNGIPDECLCVPQVYGDIAPPDGDGIVELADVLCELDGYADFTACPRGDIAPCSGDGTIELADLLNLLAAYDQQPPCADPCNFP